MSKFGIRWLQIGKNEHREGDLQVQAARTFETAVKSPAVVTPVLEFPVLGNSRDWRENFSTFPVSVSAYLCFSHTTFKPKTK